MRVLRVCIIVAFTASLVHVLPARSFTIDGPEVPPVAIVPPSPIDEIRTVAEKNGIQAEDLLAISAQESSLGKFLSGDGGCSRGWFHINLCVWDAADIIGNVAKEAQWAAERLNEYGYALDRITAIARYNRPARPNYAYAALVEQRKNELGIYLARFE